MAGHDLMDVVALAYEAAMDEARWPDALAAIRDATGGAQAAIVVQDLARARASIDFAVGVDEGPRRAYETYYAARHPMHTHHASLVRPGLVVRGETFPTEREFLRSEIYTDFMRPQGVLASLNCVLARDGATFSVLAVTRAASAGAFRAEEELSFARLAGHLRRVVALVERTWEARALGGTLSTVLDVLATPVAVVDARARVLHFNQAARELLARGLIAVDEDGALCGVRSDETRRLRSDIAQAMSGGAATGGTINLGAGGAHAIEVVTVPAPAAIRSAVGPRAAAAVLFRDPASPPRVDAAQLRRRFELTPSEVAVAIALLDGRGLDHAAAAVGITRETARTHLKRIFAKTGTHRQGELIRLLLADTGNNRPRR